MSKGINKAILIGNLGQEPETHKTNTGATICIISVATSEEWKDKTSGVLQSRTEWHRVKFFGKLADVAAQYLNKGSKVYIEGKIITEKYEKNGADQYSTVIIAKELQMLDSKNASSGASGGYQNQQAQAPQGGNSQGAAFPDFDDNSDIPFSNYQLKTL